MRGGERAHTGLSRQIDLAHRKFEHVLSLRLCDRLHPVRRCNPKETQTVSDHLLNFPHQRQPGSREAWRDLLPRPDWWRPTNFHEPFSIARLDLAGRRQNPVLIVKVVEERSQLL